MGCNRKRRSRGVTRWLLVGLLALVGCDDPSVGGEAQDSSTRTRLDNDAARSDAAAMMWDSTAPADMTPTLDPDAAAMDAAVMDAHLDAAEDLGPPPTCEELDCGDLAVCEMDPERGARCVDLRCISDDDCAQDEFCEEICRPDLCLADGTACDEDGVTLLRCLPNGGGFEPVRVCGDEDPALSSICVELEPGVARCTCADIWDCPAYFLCDRGLCEGTGEPPTCLLPAAPFAESLPEIEAVWGSPGAVGHAEGRPWPRSSEAFTTPLVVNLDDDNEDGRVDAQDFPELVFMTTCSSNLSEGGVLRAVHGGGPNRGEDFFATHGEETWRPGDDLPPRNGCQGGLRPNAILAVGDLDDPADSDGRPEIVAISDTAKIQIYDSEGQHLFTDPGLSRPWRRGALFGVGNAAPAIANIDGQGMAEIIIGREVYTLEHDELGQIRIRDIFEGDRAAGINGSPGLLTGPIGCVADLLGDERLEIIGGGTVYGLPRPPAGVVRRDECGGANAPMNDEERAFCEGRLLVHWDAATVAGEAIPQEGFCAVADVLGAAPQRPPGVDNPPDGRPEVILVWRARLLVFDGETGVKHVDVLLDHGSGGGAPNVDDFDGDGFPEVGSAGAHTYVVHDFQAATEACPAWPRSRRDLEALPMALARNPGGPVCRDDADCVAGSGVCNLAIGRCVCLHNGWRRTTEDNSSQVTGSTVFDFNGDGAAEVLYHDECWFRIYDGRTGEVLFKTASESPTAIENPVVADVDNDGNAEMVFTSMSSSGRCSERRQRHPDGGFNWERYNAGLEVWGDPADRWVPARRVWNQHAYHVTHIREDGSIPLRQVKGWQPTNGREFNIYRSQPRSAGVAPDLTVPEVGVTAIAGACSALGDHIVINAVIANGGDVRVGPGIRVAFQGQWDEGDFEPLVDDAGTPIHSVVENTLDPGRTARVSAEYRLLGNPAGHERLPDRVRVIADVGADPVFGGERECNEDNNVGEVAVRDPGNLPDLAVDRVTVTPLVCPSVEMTVHFTNIGEAPAENPTVAFYAGDPAQGGFRLGATGYAGVVASEEQVSVTTTTAKLVAGQSVRIYAVVDYTRAIPECDESNNVGRSESDVFCVGD